jgi:peptidase E
MKSKPQIVAMGGGSFLRGARDRLLDDYVLGLTGKRRPKICFIGTASGDSNQNIARFLRAYRDRAKPDHLPLFFRDEDRPPEMLLDQDVIYVGGGNTANMLLVWRLHGIDKLLRRAWRRGTILTGVSAGMNCLWRPFMMASDF